MADNGASLDEIKSLLEDAFQAHERAHTRGEFIENIFVVHGGLNRALDIHLGPEQRDVPLPDKLRAFLPSLADKHPLGWLNARRNDLAHPRPPLLNDVTVYRTSVGLVNLAEAAWFGLFTEQPPVVHHPLYAPPVVPGATSVPVAGTSVASSTGQPTHGAPGLDPLGGTAQAGRPGSVAGKTSGVPAVHLTAPAAPALAAASRVGRRLPLFAGLIVLALILGAFLLGRQNPPADPTRIGVGGRALVNVPANRVMLVMAAPGTGQAQAAHYKKGAVLEVTGGPVAYEGLTWWKVRGPDGEGWTAADYLAPMER